MSERRPNIIYFVCHDIGRHLGAYGKPVHSPCLDQFAAEGIRFNTAFCSSPACSPSRACAMTGKYAHNNGELGISHMGWSLAQDQQTIVDYLNNSGYDTIHCGMNHERHAQMNRYAQDFEYDWGDWDASAAVDRAVEFLEQRQEGKPFYLNIGTGEVHGSRYTNDRTVDEVYGGRVPEEDVYIPPYLKNSSANRYRLGGLQAALRYMDQQFERLLEALRASPHSDTTIVIFTTDHGIHGGYDDQLEPSDGQLFPFMDKGSLYDRGTEISLLMQLPQGQCSGMEVDHLIQNVDFMPTLLEAAHISIPAGINGRSFWPVLSGSNYTPHDCIMTERNFHGERIDHGESEHLDAYDPTRAVRTRQYHYIRHFKPVVRPEFMFPFMVSSDKEREEEYLFDVQNDPMECVNLVKRPEYRAVLKKMRNDLREWMEDTDDFLLGTEVPEPPEETGWGTWPIPIEQRVMK